jgi:hypothetical protein
VLTAGGVGGVAGGTPVLGGAGVCTGGGRGPGCLV